MSRTDQLISWLNDAYAMEIGLVPILQNHADDAKSDREAMDRIGLHVEETKRHAERVKGCIEKLGGQAGSVRAGLSAFMGSVESIATAPFRDELVKNTLMDYASEHFEMACYTALIAAARKAGREDIARVCEEILDEERAMACWLEGQIPVVVEEALLATRA
jgi:ferritin-like metal-binding protein YciE